MGSNAKKKTTMAKRNRETALRERRLRKQERKTARKQAAADLRSGATDTPRTDLPKEAGEEDLAVWRMERPDAPAAQPALSRTVNNRRSRVQRHSSAPR